MNIFFVLKTPRGIEIVTPSLERGDILPGITRDSILEITRYWTRKQASASATAEHIEAFSSNPLVNLGPLTVSERNISMKEIAQAADEGNLLEMFGSGTAAIIYPVKAIMYQGVEIAVPTGTADDAGPVAKKLWNVLADIQYGRVDHPWAVTI